MEKRIVKIQSVEKFWKTELTLSVLNYLLMITVFVIYPVTDKGLLSEVIFVFFVCLIFISGIFSITNKKKERAIAISFSFLLLTAAGIILGQHNGVTNEIILGIFILYLLLLALLLLKKITLLPINRFISQNL